MKHRKVILVLMACALLLSGCGAGKGGGQTDYRPVASDVAYEQVDFLQADVPLGEPTGIVCTNKNIVVADRKGHTLRLFDLDGRYAGKVGSIDKAPLQFYAPTGLAWQNNLLYVLDARNCRVQVLDEDYGFVRDYDLTPIDSENAYRDITVTADGTIYITAEHPLPKYATIYRIDGRTGRQSTIGNAMVGSVCVAPDGGVLFAQSHEMHKEKGTYEMRSGACSLYSVESGAPVELHALPYKATVRDIIATDECLYALAFGYATIDRLSPDGVYMDSIFFFDRQEEMQGFYAFAHLPDREMFLVTYPDEGKIVCIHAKAEK